MIRRIMPPPPGRGNTIERGRMRTKSCWHGSISKQTTINHSLFNKLWALCPFSLSQVFQNVLLRITVYRKCSLLKCRWKQLKKGFAGLLWSTFLVIYFNLWITLENASSNNWTSLLPLPACNLASALLTIARAIPLFLEWFSPFSLPNESSSYY